MPKVAWQREMVAQTLTQKSQFVTASFKTSSFPAVVEADCCVMYGSS